MFKIIKGCLTMDNYDLDHLTDEIEDGYNPREILKSELELAGLNIKDVYDIEFKGEQLKNPRHADTLARIICNE